MKKCFGKLVTDKHTHTSPKETDFEWGRTLERLPCIYNTKRTCLLGFNSEVKTVLHLV